MTDSHPEDRRSLGLNPWHLDATSIISSTDESAQHLDDLEEILQELNADSGRCVSRDVPFCSVLCMQLYRLVAILWDIMKRRTPNAAAAFMTSDDDSTRYYASLPPVSQIRCHWCSWTKRPDRRCDRGCCRWNRYLDAHARIARDPSLITRQPPTCVSCFRSFSVSLCPTESELPADPIGDIARATRRSHLK